MDYLNNKTSLSRRSSQRSNRSASPRSSHFTRRSPPKTLNLTYTEDPLLALVAAANNTMPLTPPPDQPTFQHLDASLKMPDTPMADQFNDDDLESVLSEEELDMEKAHLVLHAKVYAIAEKYVLRFRHSVFCSFLLIARPDLPVSFHLRLQIWQPWLRCGASRRLKHRQPRDLRHHHHHLPITAFDACPTITSTSRSSTFFAFVYDLMIGQLPISSASRAAVSRQSASAYHCFSNHATTLYHLLLEHDRT
jgi:hypothetical protein